jgi:peptidyl-prolyl cis-trans isomerase C
MKKSTLFFFLLLVGLTGTNVYYAFENEKRMRAEDPQDVLNCRQLLKHANNLSSKKLFSVAADAYADYADRCAQSAGDAAYTQLRLGDLYAEAGDFEYALASYYKAEALDEKIKKHTGPKIVAALEKMNLSSEARFEQEKRVAVDEKTVKKEGKAVARVGDVTVYEEDVLGATDSLPPEMRKAAQTPQVKQMLIKQYVVQEAVAQRAKRMGLDKDPLVVKTEEMMRKQLLVKAVLEKEIAEKAKVTDEEVRAAYDAQKERFAQPAQVQVAVIESEDTVKAKELLNKTTETVLMDDTFTYIPGVGEAEAAVAEILKLPVGAVSAPFASGGKTYVAMVKERKEGTVTAFDEVKDGLKTELAKAKQQKETDAFVNTILEEEAVQMYPDENK